MNVGFAMCGSLCTFDSVFRAMEDIARHHNVTPILSQASCAIDSRFGTGKAHVEKVTELCKKAPLISIEDVEPIGPKKLLDALIVAPCTGNTLAKLAHGIADGPVTMAVKSHLRNGRPVIVAISTNDALAAAAENIGRLLPRKNYYFVPFRQDDPVGKPTSIVADFSRILPTLEAALEGKQLQPLLIGS